MARLEYEKHVLSDDIYTVSKDDGNKERQFTNEDEADAYYEYLEREEVQDSIAKNQALAVEQNKRIIENQERLLKAQEEQKQKPKQYEDPEIAAWKRRDAVKRIIEEERQRKIGMELSTLALKVDRGEVDISKIDSRSIDRIINEKLYIFTSKDVILEISKNIYSQKVFSSFWSQYCDNKEIAAKVVRSPAIRAASADIIIQLLKDNEDDEDVINNILENGEEYVITGALLQSDNLDLIKRALDKGAIPHSETWSNKIYWLENKNRLLDGNISSDKDLEIAEAYCKLGKGRDSFAFLCSLASKSSDSEIHSFIRSRIWGLSVSEHKINESQAIQLYFLLFRNSNCNDINKSHIAHELIKICTTKESLLEIKDYCHGDDLIQWYCRMQQLGYISNREWQEGVLGPDYTDSDNLNKGCIWGVILVLGLLLIIFLAK